jgi:hypothetical protein
MLTGSLYVADSLESGVAISGYKNTGFVRSLGYEGFTAGFPGFLLWSGSALSGSLGTKGGVPYNGVGLELYGDANNYFRYSTNPSELDVHTETFFFGDPNSQYISGSNGNLEISSSGFYLTADGDVTASSFIALNGGDVLFDSNSEFVDGKNVGRIVYFDQTEVVFDLSTISGAVNAQTASVFQTYILPGETRCQMSYTYEITNNNPTNVVTVQCRAYIGSASLGPISNSSYYSAFQDETAIGSPLVVGAVPAATTESGANNQEATSGGGTALTLRQGMYVQIYLVVYSPSTLPTGTVKMKNFVWRTSRIVGSTTITPSGPPIFEF